jgi:hypothetical protein
MNLNGFDVRGEEGEGPFHAYSIGDLPHREGSRMANSLTLNDITFEALDTLLIAFNDLIVDSDIITGLELRELYLSCQLLVYKSYSSVHNFNFLRMAKVTRSIGSAKLFWSLSKDRVKKMGSNGPR